ncbi:hypothetical protein [Lentzea waywayandensis]|nr:hypothetical protein [Lentzea waywayandensis]
MDAVGGELLRRDVLPSAGGAPVVLVVAMALAVYKPRGVTGPRI